MKNIAELNCEDLHRIASAKWSGRKYEGKCLDGAWIAESDLGTAPAIKKMLSQCVDEVFLGYTPDWLKDEAKAATASLQRYHHNWQVSPEQVFIAPDVLAILKVFIRCATDIGDEIIIPTPAYMPFLTIPPNLDRRAVEVPSICNNGHWDWDWQALEKAFASERAKIAILCNPWNPTGRVMSELELRRFGDLCVKYGVKVFADEIHFPVIFPGQSHRCFAALSPDFAAITVTAQAASKGWNVAGLKCAQMIVTDEILLNLFPEQILCELAGGASTLGLRAAVTAYTEGLNWITDLNSYLTENYKLLLEMGQVLLPQVEISRNQGTFIAFWDCSPLNLTEAPLDIIARDAGVSVNAGCCMGKDYPAGVRFNFATPRQILEPMLERTFTALRSAGH